MVESKRERKKKNEKRQIQKKIINNLTRINKLQIKIRHFIKKVHRKKRSHVIMHDHLSLESSFHKL